MPNQPDRNFLESMPKVELHVHIEGSIQPSTVLQLAQKNKIDLPANTLEDLQAWYKFRDFEHFVEVYVAVSKCIRSADDLTLIFREFLAGQKSQNIHHTEATYTACTIEKYCNIPWQEQLEVIEQAVQWGEKELGITLGLILDIVRGDTLERAFEVLEWVKQGQGRGVIALGLAGVEKLGTRQYEPVFTKARELGLHTICHAGETSDSRTIWDVLNLAHSKRIGHGVRCTEDEALMKHLIEQQIPLEVCPTSNVCIGVFPSLAQHPFKKLLDAGVKVTINSDDPPMFSTSLTDEWIQCCDTFDLSLEEVKKVSLNAIDSALIEPNYRSKLRSLLLQHF